MPSLARLTLALRLRVPFVLGVDLAWLATAHAAPPAPLAQLAPPSGPALRVDADGALRAAGSPQPIADLHVGTALPEHAFLRAVPGASELVEVRVVARARGRLVLLRLGAAPTVVFDEPTGPNEDGELVRRVEIGDAGPRRWQETSGSTRCDSHPPLFLEAFDSVTKTWRAIALPVPKAPDLARTAPRPAKPSARALRFSSASVDGKHTRADYLGAPRELDDGNPATALQLGQGPAIAGAFLTAQAQRTVDLVALRIDPPPAPARLPAALVLIGGTPPRPLHRLVLGGSGSVSFVLPAPVHGSCVSFVVDDRGEAALAIGEMSLELADDGPGGLTALARNISAQTDESEGSARALECAGKAGAEAALAELATATGAGKQRLLAVVHTLRTSLPSSAIKPLARLLETAHGAERPLLVATLGTLGAKDALVQGEVERIFLDRAQASEARSDAVELAALFLADSAPAAHTVFTAAFDDEPLVARTARRLAARWAASSPPLAEELRTSLLTLAAGKPVTSNEPRLRAEIIVALTGGAAAAFSPTERVDLAGVILGLGAPQSLPFALAVRVLTALRALDAAAATRAIANVLQHSEDATLRLVAIDSIPEGTAVSTLRQLASSAARDSDARVREHALAWLLAASGPGLVSIYESSSDDLWPQVRKLAYRGLGAQCATDSAIVARLDARVFGKLGDKDGRARAEALAALASCPRVGAERIAAAINPKQPSDVRERAAQLLADRGPSVLPLLTRALDRTYSAGGMELPFTAGALLSAIGRVGARGGEQPYDDTTLTLLRDAAADPFFPGIRIAAIAAIASGCPAGAKVIFDRADHDPEPAVQRAATVGRNKCGR